MSNSTTERIEKFCKENELKLPTVKEHYLQTHDLLEIQYGNIERDFCTNSELVQLIVSLIDLANVEKVVEYCFNWEKQDVLFTVIELLFWRKESQNYRQEFTVGVYCESISRRQLHYALRI